jgi:hypothetical protein
VTEGIIPKKRTTFYIEPNLLKEFKGICAREDESMSQKVEKWIARYIAIHIKGNPQLRLESFIGEVQEVCFQCEGHFPNLVKAKFRSGLVADVCPTCLEEKKKHGLVKHVYGSG